MTSKQGKASTQVSPDTLLSPGSNTFSSMNSQSQAEITNFIRSEVERQTRRLYDSIFDEVDLRINKALGKMQPVEKADEAGGSNFRVLDGWRQLDVSMPWGQSSKVENAGTYKALSQTPQGASFLIGEETCGSIDTVVLLPSDDGRRSPCNSVEEALVPADGDEEGKWSLPQRRFRETWLALVEAGQLDIYTCLGLSNAFTNTPDTRKIWAKAFSVATMQLVVPCIMIFAEVEHGMTIHPCVSDQGFRFIGAVLYTYSVYTMYNNANCASRSELSNMLAEYDHVPMGFWIPLRVGELLNVVVAVILVITLYQIYTHQNEPADLILNAVAVNFLGSVDSELVNEEMKLDAITNFKELTSDLFKGPSSTGEDYDPDAESMVDFVIRYSLYGVGLAGFAGSIIFMTVATAENPLAQVHHGMRHAGLGHVV